MDQNEKIRSVIERVGDLPAMPELVSRVLLLTDDPSIDMDEVSQVIQHDPSLTAKILCVGNSPYYGMKQYVGTLKLALVILGVREIRNIVLSVGVFDTFQNKASSPLGGNFWGHCFLTGALSKSLGNLLGLDLQGEAFSGGLLHDIGKLVLARHLGGEYASIVERTKGNGAELCAAEREKLGFTHADAAAALAEQWNFPKTLSDAIWLHHPSEEHAIPSAKDPELAAVVRVGNLLAHRERGPAAVAAACSEEEAWRILGQAPSPVDPDGREEALTALQDEIEECPVPIS